MSAAFKADQPVESVRPALRILLVEGDTRTSSPGVETESPVSGGGA